MKKITKIICSLSIALVLGCGVALAQDPDPNAFITVWKPTSDVINFPGRGTNYTIVVRDLSTNTIRTPITNVTSDFTNPYPITGLTPNVEYAIEVLPNGFDGFKIIQLSEEQSWLLEIRQWGIVNWKFDGLTAAFRNCENLDLTATDKPIFAPSTVLSQLFSGCKSLKANPSISDWDTSNVRMMNHMFNRASLFNQPLNWDVSRVVDMTSMFNNATSFNQNLGDWKFRSDYAVKMNYMLNGTGMDCDNYAATLIGWANNPDVPSGVTFTATGVEYSETATDARNFLINTKGWSITDAGLCTSTDVLNVPNESKFELRNNPLSDLAHFSFKSSDSQSKIIFVDISGKVVQIEILPAGSQEVEVSVSGLLPGIYMVQHRDGYGNYQTLKMVKR